MAFFRPCFRYMEEVIESTFSLLSFHHDHGSVYPETEKALEPIHLLALLDIKATWFKKWMVCIATLILCTVYSCVAYQCLYCFLACSYCALSHIF